MATPITAPRKLCSWQLEVRHRSDVAPARRLASVAAAESGFPPVACEEIALVVSELSTNLLKHAGGGQLVLKTVARLGRAGLQIDATDDGPGLPDHSLEDGFSTTGTLGVGLGAVNRLADEVKIKARRSGGTHVCCRKWIREKSLTPPGCPLDIGAASRGKLADNGDEFVIRRWGAHALVGVIDGCGHGEPAHRAARIARHYVEGHYESPLVDIFAGVERDCRATRGVVMALARFNGISGEVSFASVGNIESRMWTAEEAKPVKVRRGILGAHASRPALTTHPWTADSILVMHSDGVNKRWDRTVLGRQAHDSADVIARSLLRQFGKALDDATVVVVRGKET